MTEKSADTLKPDLEDLSLTKQRRHQPKFKQGLSWTLVSTFNFNLSQMVTAPTGVFQDFEHILDWILTSPLESMLSITYLPEVSDHKVIHAGFAFQPPICQTTQETIPLYDMGNYAAIFSEIAYSYLV